MGFFLLLAVVMTALAAREPGVAAETWHYKIIFCLLSFAFFMSLAAPWIALVALAMAFLRPLRGIVGQHSIELRADGLVEKTDINESLHKWAGVRRIRRTGSYLQIYVTDIMYHTIPIAAFQSRLHADAFLMQVRSRRDAAQS